MAYRSKKPASKRGRKRKSKNVSESPKKLKADVVAASSSKLQSSSVMQNFSNESDVEDITIMDTLRDELGLHDMDGKDDFQQTEQKCSDSVQDTEAEVQSQLLICKEIPEVGSNLPESIEDDDEKTDEPVIQIYSDPFEEHLHNELHPSLLKSLTSCNSEDFRITTENWPLLGQFQLKSPICDAKDCKPATSLDEEVVYTQGGRMPSIYNLNHVASENLHIKPQILKNLKNITQKIDAETETNLITPFQNELFSIINNYYDFLYTQRTLKNAEDIRFVYCLHIVNHILKTRNQIIRNNDKILENDMSVEYRDQGLVRPKVLVIVPFKDSAYKIVSLIEDMLITENKGNVMNKKRFLEEYTGDEIVMPKINRKPRDFELTFAGNTSDQFKMGISVTKKSLKLFADFYSADIIIASPLGLRTIIGAEGEPERDFDFLASIEILILDQVEIFKMQNWDHLTHILEHLHLQPKESHGTDFLRIRQWSLSGHAKFYRQTLAFSSINLPEIMAIFNKYCANYEGLVKIAGLSNNASISKVIIQMPHRFYKFSPQNVMDSVNERFDFFVNNILSDYKDVHMAHTAIFIPNYFDYVKLRNYFKKEMMSFTQICEYTKPEKVARARDMFFHGDAHFMLYTERYHFYNRIKLKGIRHLIFYSPPTFPHFYTEMCNLMEPGNMNPKQDYTTDLSVSVIYSKYDVLPLSAIIGKDRATKIIKCKQKSVFMLVTGEK